jgi:septation ring formation regulator EzrA
MNEDLTKTLQSQDEKLTLILTTVQSLTVRVDSIDSRLQHVDSRLQRVEQTIDDARPVWHLLLTDVAHLREGQLQLEAGQRRLEEGQRRLEERSGRLEEGQEGLRSELHAFRRRVDHRFLILSGSVLSRYNELEQRVTHLELNSTPPNIET